MREINADKIQTNQSVPQNSTSKMDNISALAWDLQIGDDMGQYDYVLTPWRIVRYIDIVGDPTSWFSDTSPFGERVVTPMICCLDFFHLAKFRRLWDEELSKIKSFFWAKQEIVLVNPAKPNKRITVNSKVINKYVKDKGKYLVWECISADEGGMDILICHITVRWPETANLSV